MLASNATSCDDLDFDDGMFLSPYLATNEQKSEDLGIDNPLLDCVPRHAILPPETSPENHLHTLVDTGPDIVVSDEDQTSWCMYTGVDGAQSAPQYHCIEPAYSHNANRAIVDSSLSLVELLQRNRAVHPELSPLKSPPVDSAVKASPTLVKILLSGSSNQSSAVRPTVKNEQIKSSLDSKSSLTLGKKLSPSLAGVRREAKRSEERDRGRTSLDSANNVRRPGKHTPLKQSSPTNVPLHRPASKPVPFTASPTKLVSQRQSVSAVSMPKFSSPGTSLLSRKLSTARETNSSTATVTGVSQTGNMVVVKSERKLSVDDMGIFQMFNDDGQQAAIEALDVNSLLEVFESATAEFDMSPSVTKVEYSSSDADLQGSRCSDSTDPGVLSDFLEVVVADGSNSNSSGEEVYADDSLSQTFDSHFADIERTKSFGNAARRSERSSSTDDGAHSQKSTAHSRRQLSRKISLSQYRTRPRPAALVEEEVVQHTWGVLTKAEADELERQREEEKSRRQDELVRIRTDHDYCLPDDKVVHLPGSKERQDSQESEESASAGGEHTDRNPALKALLLDDNLGREMRDQAVVDRKLCMEQMDSSLRQRSRQDTVCDVIDMDLDEGHIGGDACATLSSWDEMRPANRSTSLSADSVHNDGRDPVNPETLYSIHDTMSSEPADDVGYMPRRGRTMERKYRHHHQKREEESVHGQNSALCMDRLPNYMTALAVPSLTGNGRASAVRAVQSHQVLHERDASPSRVDDAQLFNKLPSYHSCFTNSTKYDNVDSLAAMAEEAPTESSSRSQSPVSMHDLSPNDHTGLKRRRSRSASSSSSHSSSGWQSRSKPPVKKFAISRSRSPNDRLSFFRSVSMERQRQRDEEDRERRKVRQMEERKIVYVGGIPEGFTHKDLSRKFESFGTITNCSVHFRQHGDNYGFVTFKYACDAFAMKEKGRTVQGCENFDFCFGGRRHFCKDDYADLDGNKEDEEELMAPMLPASSGYNSRGGTLDFDSLLQQAQRSISKRGK